jgi:hypothetical protein
LIGPIGPITRGSPGRHSPALRSIPPRRAVDQCLAADPECVGLASSAGFGNLPRGETEGFIKERKAMSKPRFQFNINALLIAVALIAVPLSFLRPSSNGNARVIDLFGPVRIRQDGSVEVRGGSIRMRHGDQQTSIRASTIIIHKDGTAHAVGAGSIVQTQRSATKLP